MEDGCVIKPLDQKIKMLRSKLENSESGILLYGITPPKSGHSPEKIMEIADRQRRRIESLDIDGLVLYDIQDESSRNSQPRPFPFIETIDPWTYSREYLGGLDVPRVIYNGVGRYTPESFAGWLGLEGAGLDLMVLVGSPSRQSTGGLSLHDAYNLKRELNDSALMGGVTIPERHARKADEHLRVASKTLAGCRFFISQCVYNVRNALIFLTDYCNFLNETGGKPVPIIFTITPCGSLKTLHFMEWLGIEIPEQLRKELETSPDMLARSVEACRSIVDELVSHGSSLCVPIGFNVESVAVRKDEIEASLALVRYIKDKYRR